MKKWLVILGSLMVLGGCQDSTSNVAPRSVRPMVAEPDTILALDSLSIEVYLPDNPRAREVGAQLETNAGVHMAQGRLTEAGYSDESSDPFYMRATTLDGRVLEATWFPNIESQDGRFAMIGHIRMGNREFVVPIRANTTSDPAHPDVDLLIPTEKGEWKPSTIFNFGLCANFAVGLFYACLNECSQFEVSQKTCKWSCLLAAGAAYVTCILFTSIGQ